MPSSVIAFATASVFGAAVTGAVAGAVVGGVVSAISGGNVLKGIVKGALIGGVAGGVAGFASGLPMTEAVTGAANIVPGYATAAGGGMNLTPEGALLQGAFNPGSVSSSAPLIGGPLAAAGGETLTSAMTKSAMVKGGFDIIGGLGKGIAENEAAKDAEENRLKSTKTTRSNTDPASFSVVGTPQEQADLYRVYHPNKGLALKANAPAGLARA